MKNKRAYTPLENTNSGQLYEIIDYSKRDDIIVENISCKERIGCSHVEKRLSRLGESRIMNNGIKATIVAYRDSRDIDVKFETGEVRTSVEYNLFKRGVLALKKPRERHLGEMRTMNCGLKATVIEYHNCTDIDVKFETGEVRTGVTYQSFKRGALVIKKPRECRVGESHMMNCGKTATIIAYRGSDDIDVQFDTGEIRCGVSYHSFNRGKVFPLNHEDRVSAHIGERKLMSCGVFAEIISWNNNRDITVKYDDGRIIEHARYEYFKKGTLGSRRQRSITENIHV